MKDRARSVQIFSIGAALALMASSYTRILSFKLVDPCAYFIMAVALLGIGAGGVVVAITSRLRQIHPQRLVALDALFAAATVSLGYLAVAGIQLDLFATTRSGAEVVRVFAVCLLVFMPFFLGGVGIAALLSAGGPELNRLCFAGLAGAALGCAIWIPLLWLFTPPACVVLSGAVFALVAAHAAFGEARSLFRLSSALAVATLLVALFPRWLPDPVPERIKGLPGREHVHFSQWSPQFRIDVADVNSRPGVYGVSHDGILWSTTRRFEGSFAALDDFDSDVRAIPFSVLNRPRRVLIVGAVGVDEVLASLHFGATQITALAADPVTASLLTKDLPRLKQGWSITVINAEARSFLRRDRAKYDLIWYVSPGSQPASSTVTSAALGLTETSQYTVEAIAEALTHLAVRGIVAMQLGEARSDVPNRAARYVATAREALEQLQVRNFPRHVLVSTSSGTVPVSTVLVRKIGFGASEITAFIGTVGDVPGAEVQNAWYVTVENGAVTPVITLKGQDLSRWYDIYPYDISPVWDDSPFFWHFARFAHVFTGTSAQGWDMEATYGERLLLLLLAVVSVMVAVFGALPFVIAGRTWREIPHQADAAVSFAALGGAFVLFVVSVGQKLALFIGSSLHAQTATLFGLFLWTGITTLLSGRYRRRNLTLGVLMGSIVVLALFYQFGLSLIVAPFRDADLFVRLTVAVILLAPLGMCFGSFTVMGFEAVCAGSPRVGEVVPWLWGMSALLAVFASVLATIMSMVLGFTAVLFAAGLMGVMVSRTLMSIPAAPATGS
jgi:hypothetical protein